MRQFALVTFVLMSMSTAALAVTEPLGRVIATQHVAGELYVWQRLDLSAPSSASRKASQIRVAIRTRGPSLQGLIRIPGAPASNFDTGTGQTIVDLINVGGETRGYAQIVALEILFTQATLGQPFEAFAVVASSSQCN